MYIARRALTFVQGFLTSYAPTSIKKLIWDTDFSSGKWDFLDNTSEDCVYPLLEKYAHGGDILDLGCGPGNTANELSATAYRNYVGVDISEAALAKAVKRTQENAREQKNTFVQSDFLGYTPSQEFDIILFRESLYHVPYGQVLKILKKYSRHLKAGGVFIVRLYTGNVDTGRRKVRVLRKINLIKRKFDVLESPEFKTWGLPNVLVFRPQHDL